MAIRLVTGPANAGKAELVLDAVRRDIAHGREPLLVVPTALDAEHYLRELCGEGVLLGARVERFEGLIDEVVRRAGLAAPVLDGVARERVLEALADAAGMAALSGGYARALGELFAELQVRRVTPARFTQALAAWSAVDGQESRRRSLGEIYSEYRRVLRRLRTMDAPQRAVAALDALREQPALWGGTPVALYGFDDFTMLQRDAIETLGRIVDAPLTVSLPYEPGRVAFAGRAGTYEELAPLAAEIDSLSARAEHYAPSSRVPLSHLERRLFEPDAGAVAPAGALALIEGGGERAELELVALRVRELLTGGMAAEEIAVIARPPLLGSELLGEVFAQAGVPIARHQVQPFADTALGAALLGLLRVAADEDGRGGPASLGDLLAWLRAPGLLERPLLVDRFEVLARRRGIDDAGRARALWEERHWPLDAIEHVREAARRGPAALAERAASELARLFAAPRARVAATFAGEEELGEARALAVGERALAALRELSRGARELAPAGPAQLARCLARIELSSPARPAPGTVAVVDALALRARRVGALFLCGMQEGAFPQRVRMHPLLDDDDRARLAETSGLRLDRAPDPIAAERYLLYATVSRPQQLLTLSWHLADDDGEPTPRSLFVDDVCDLFDAELLQERARRPLGALPFGQRPGEADPETIASLHDPRVLAEVAELVWSASSLERWQRCPVGWLVEKQLAPRELEPEAEPLAQGGLAHDALERVLEALRAATGSARPRPENLPLALELLEQALADGQSQRPLSVSPERAASIRRRLDADLRRYLTRAARDPDGLEPQELELGFGFRADDERGGGATLAPLSLAGGVELRGRIDRIDATPEGTAVVIDYKSSLATAVARWRSEGKLQLALYMLAVERLLGKRVVGGLYQPLTGSLQPRGAVQEGSAAEAAATTRTDVISEQELRDTLDWAERSAVEIAALARSGELEPRPQRCAFRGGCMYPSICRSDP